MMDRTRKTFRRPQMNSLDKKKGGGGGGEGAREKLAKQVLKVKKQINKTNTNKQTKTETTQTAHRL